MRALDRTHDPAARSWVESANVAGDFPIQNLPLGVFVPEGGEARCGIAIGDQILDLRAAYAGGHISQEAAAGAVLDPLFALGADAMRTLRHEVFPLLHRDTTRRRAQLLHPRGRCEMLLPSSVRSYTDFFAGIHHAIRCAELMGGPGTPLSPNYHHQPIAYNGRASTVQPSGALVRRPAGVKNFGRLAPEPRFGPSEWLDFELELGFFVGPGNRRGEPIPLPQAGRHVLGFCLLNDWSARDVQFFEMAPLGAFNSKSFATTISPWVITTDALAPFRVAAMSRLPGAPALWPYLDDAGDREAGALALALQATISTARMRECGQPPFPVAASDARYLYWTFGQMVTHHTIGGCDVGPGDLFGTGTISAPSRAGYGSLFELSEAGQSPLVLPNGETRTFLEDGDEVTFTARAERDGYVPIGFGECLGRVVSAWR